MDGPGQEKRGWAFLVLARLHGGEKCGILSLALPANGRRLAPDRGQLLSPDLRKGGLPNGYIFRSDPDRYFSRWHYRPLYDGQ